MIDRSASTQPDELHDVEVSEPQVALLWQRLIRAELLRRLGRVEREQVTLRVGDRRLD